MELAQLPPFISSRRVGMGSFGSRRSYAGKPSRLIRITERSLAGMAAPQASPRPKMNGLIRARARQEDALFTGMIGSKFHPTAQWFSVLKAQGWSDRSKRYDRN